MVVAGGAAYGESEEDAADRLGAVLGVDRLVLLRDDTPFVRRDVVPLEAGRDPLIERRLLEQVARHLFDGEFVERLVLVEGANHPVAVGVHLPVVVDMDAVRIPVARCIEPVARPVLAPLPCRKQSVDVPLVRIGCGVVQECLECLGRGRQSGQVVGRAARQRPAVGLRCGSQALRFEPRQDEPVDRHPRPGAVRHGGWLGTQDRFECPVLIPVGALIDPAPQRVDLIVGERLVRCRGRHPEPRVGMRDPLDHEAGAGIPGDHGLPVRTVRDQTVFRVEPQPDLPRALVRPVAQETVIGQDRPHFALEVDRRRPGGRLGLPRPEVDGRARCGGQQHPGQDQNSRITREHGLLPRWDPLRDSTTSAARTLRGPGCAGSRVRRQVEHSTAERRDVPLRHQMGQEGPAIRSNGSRSQT